MKDKPSENQKAYQGMLTEGEVNYVTLSSVKGKACANCRWFLNDGCFIVADWGPENPEPIIATGYCDRHELSPEPEPTVTEVLAEAIANSSESLSTAILAVLPTDDMSKAVKPRKSLTEWARAQKEKLFPDKQKGASFQVFKGVDGEYHWHAVYSNNFEDRENEILTAEGHKNFITRLDMGLIPMPVLDVWHIEGTEHGQTDLIWSEEIPSVDGTKEMLFVHAIGHFDKNEMGEKAIEYYKHNIMKNSHAFLAPEWAFDGKHYSDFNTIKISTLPPYAAANPYTSFEELKEMALTPDKEALIVQMWGKEKLAEIKAADQNKAKSLEAVGTVYKEFAQVNPPAASTPAAPTPNDDKPTTEKALQVLYAEISESQAEIIKALELTAKGYGALSQRLETISTEIKTVDTKHETETSAWQKALDDIRAAINLPIERASSSTSTVVSKDDAKLKDQTPQESGLAKFLPGIGLKTPSPATS